MKGTLPLLGSGLRESLAEGYGLSDLRQDLQAGIIVGIVALPLSMALAIASGVPPQYGLYTAIVAGAVTAMAGGSRVQVSGPTAAFVVILAPISARFGVGGLCLASLMAGAILVLMGLGRFGRFVSFIPYPVTAGFTAGIAVVIATLQIRDLLALPIARMPEHFPERVLAMIHALPDARWADAVTGFLTLLVLVFWPRVVTRKVPAPLVALGLAGIGTYAAGLWLPGFEVATIGTRFSHVVDGLTRPGIPGGLPLPLLPWSLPGPDGEPLGLSLSLLRDLIGPAFAIAMLGAIESLLSAIVADGMTGRQHDSDGELVGQGLGNLVAPFFGGIAATGAIARTATNIRYGARSPLSSVFHALFVLCAMLLLAPLLAHLPMASLAALLLVVAWNMGDLKQLVRALRTSPRGDALVLLSCLCLTVVFDMVIAVTVGVVFAALLFMKRMAETASADLVSEGHPRFDNAFPMSVVVYEVAGPLFFGAAQKAMSTLRTVRKNVRVVLLDLRAVPLIDSTGLVSLESAVARLHAAGIFVVLGGVRDEPRSTLARAGWRDRPGALAICSEFPEAAAIIRRHLGIAG